jgi:hypothetical protein
MLTRRPYPRLTVDRAAYVEFHSARAIYHIVVETVQDTKITVETSDFDTVVTFLLQYIDGRVAEAMVLEAAS